MCSSFVDYYSVVVPAAYWLGVINYLLVYIATGSQQAYSGTVVKFRFMMGSERWIECIIVILCLV